MKNILLFSDLHISKESLKESIIILEEIGMLANQYNCDTIIDLGDTFDNLKPTPQELDIFATFIKRLNKKLIVIAANSHESESKIDSVLNHYGILSERVTIVKEFIDENRLYCGHFSIKESVKNYDANLSKDDLKRYKQVWLGHIHSYQIIKPNICHLGSSRYVNFDEINDKKVIAIITDYHAENEKTRFLALKSPISMKQVSISDLSEKGQPTLSGEKSVEETIEYLDNLVEKTKIKVIIRDFFSYKKWLTLSIPKSYDKKFVKFIVENNFTVINSVLSSDNTKKEILNLKESFNNFCDEKKIDNEIKDIIKGEFDAL